MELDIGIQTPECTNVHDITVTHVPTERKGMQPLGLGPERNRGEKRLPDYKKRGKSKPDYVRGGAKP